MVKVSPSKVPVVFHDVMPAVLRGEVDAGLVIHEGRFVYESLGLSLVEDLGAWWERSKGLPLPLGAILLRRDAVGLDAVVLQRLLRQSVTYALEHPNEPMEYVRAHARELDDEVTCRHIELYVNPFSVDVGDEGERAVRTLLSVGAGAGATLPELFPPDS